MLLQIYLLNFAHCKQRIMISAAKIKLIHSLSRKKYRIENGLFLAEGPKLVDELSGRFPCTFAAGTAGWMEHHRGFRANQIECVSDTELAKASLLQSPQEVLALFRLPDTTGDIHIAEKELCLALDGVQDPGNLGTIVRIADWFGIEHIFCSTDTADVFNPKAVQATMGAIARVQVHYMHLTGEIAGLPAGVPVYGTFMDGKDIYSTELHKSGIIVMGNEGSGISPEMENLVTERIGIPSFPAGRATSESLNVAVATAITCSEFRRRNAV